MSLDVSKEKELQRLREMLENDPVLREIVELAAFPGTRMPKYEDLLIPYVSAPGLTGTPWK